MSSSQDPSSGSAPGSSAPDSISSQFVQMLRGQRLRTRWNEWAVLAALLLVGVVALTYLNALPRVDLFIGDQVARLNPRTASPDVVIVAIDDASLAAVGRWPWRRGFHAALLDRIAADGPKAIGLDLVLSETDPVSVGDDQLLADAMRRAKPVVLPFVLQDTQGSGRLRRVEPVEPLASAGTLSHIHLETDIDGVVRSVFLREGLANDGDVVRPGQPVGWEHFGVAVLRAGGFALPEPLPGERAPASTSASSRGAWLRDHRLQIPFAGPSGSFKRVPYIDVLQGRVAPGTFSGKYVLVGATSGGMGDAYPTPYTGQADLMPGVEIAASVMNSLLQRDYLARASTWQAVAFNIVPVALALTAVALLAPTLSLIASAGLVLLTLVATWAAARYAGLQFGPAAALLGLLLAYPLWIWRRLRAALGYLMEEFQRMEARRDLPPMRPSMQSGDLLDRHIDALRNASEQLRNLHQFVSDTLGSLPDATIIADPAGQVLMSNHAAQKYFHRQGVREIKGLPLTLLLAGVQRSGTSIPAIDPEQLRYETSAWGGEARDADGRDLLVKCVPCFNTEGLATGWIVSLVDISHIRETERQRDLALRFISHDMRAPQSSILALLELQRMKPEQPMSDEALARIDRHARRTLDLAEEFVQLARAESSDYEMELQDLSELLGEAVDDMWVQAQTRHIRFQIERPPEPALCDADRSLMTRAIGNLLGNAVKYGREHTEVICAVQAAPGGWRVSITDHGEGMTSEEQARLFKQFSRLKTTQGDGPGGVGLGLVFVRTVIERHGGKIDVYSKVGQGTTFHFTLPAARI